ncbi:MAG: hypothetical protein JNJ57_02365 [Saprospiraceae bacterium]|nr:hypothetical protein [Saprospiraceae bacterium]
MLTNKDYSKMTLDELVSKEAKMKSLKTTTYVFVGVLFGIAIFAATRGKFILTVALLGAAMVFGGRYTKELQDLRAEIDRREGGA